MSSLGVSALIYFFFFLIVILFYVYDDKEEEKEIDLTYSTRFPKTKIKNNSFLKNEEKPLINRNLEQEDKLIDDIVLLDKEKQL